MRKVKLTFLALCFLLALLMVVMHSCMTFRMSAKEVDAYFHERNLEVSQRQYTQDFRNIHYIQTGDTTKPLVLFVHGSPGSLSAFIDFLADTILLKHALLISTDRPGFGYSNFGDAETSLGKQASLLKPIVEKHKQNKPVVLVGHSLGGPVIARMAMDYPDLIDGLVLVAASIDPELEPNETWFRAPLATPFLSWLLPRSFRSSNEEIYQLKPQLKEMEPLWNSIRCPVVVIQGGKDDLVPPGNADFARKKLTQAPVEFILKDDMNHFVPWSNPELVREGVMRLLRASSLRDRNATPSDK